MDASSGYSLLMSNKNNRWLKGALALAVLALVVLVALAAAGVFSHCVQAPSPLTVNVNFNASGHLESQTSLDAGNRSVPGGLQLDVQHSIKRCGPPPPGYHEVPDIGYYRLYYDGLLWLEAKEFCQAQNAHLIVLNSQAEALAIQELVNESPKSGFSWYAGFHDIHEEGDHFTIFEKPLADAGYTEWCPGEPTNHDSDENVDENCGGIRVSDTRMCLNDVPCYMNLPFVCEIC